MCLPFVVNSSTHVLPPTAAGGLCSRFKSVLWFCLNEMGWKPHVGRYITEYPFTHFQDPIATVTSVTSKPKSKWRPLPLDTVVRIWSQAATGTRCTHCITQHTCYSITCVQFYFFSIWSHSEQSSTFIHQQELEKLASRKLKISAKETMKIAEKLYTQGWVHVG